MRLYKNDDCTHPLFHSFENIMEAFYPELEKIDLVKMHVWSFLDIDYKIHNKTIKLYYETKDRIDWDTSIQCLNLTMKEFVYGFINCVYDNIDNDTLVPYLRYHVSYFKNKIYAKQHYNIYIKYDFNAVRDIEEAIIDYITYENKKFKQDYMVYSINYYNNTCSLNHQIKHILNNN